MSSAVIETNHGSIKINLLPELAPETVRNFTKLAQSGFYDGTLFHRVIPGFMIQGGDPKYKEQRKAYVGNRRTWITALKAEFNSRSHK